MVGLMASGLIGAGAILAWYAAGTEQRTLMNAAKFERAGDLRSAGMLLEQAVRAHPEHVAACRAWAEFLDRIGAPESIAAWRNVLKLAPTDDRARLQLSVAAMRGGDFDLVEESLSRVGEATKATADYHRVGAGLALARGHRTAAGRHLTALLSIDPENPRNRFMLAAYQLKENETADAARAELESLARAGPLALRATLELMADAPRRWPNATSPEDLLAARLWGTTVGSLAPKRAVRFRFFDHLRRQPAEEPVDANIFLEWCVRENLPAEGLAWLDAQKAAIRNSPLLLAVLADAAVAVDDWPRFANALERGAWGAVPSELVRAVIDFRREKRAGRIPATSWSMILSHHRLSLPGLRALWRLAEFWRLPTESDQTLAVIIASFPQQRWAWEILEYRCRRSGNTDALWRHYNAWWKAAPQDELLQLERLLLAYLTGRVDAEMKGQVDALPSARKREPLGLAVRAMALRADGRGEEALVLVDTTEDPVWHRARLALVQGLLLAENGREADAARVLPWVKGPLLPEEQALLQAAWARVRK